MRTAIKCGVALAVALLWSTATFGGVEDWNDGKIKWMSYEDGLKEAQKTHRPVCLIFYTSWCPHCANYSKVFSNEDVVAKAKSFVMIRLDKDKNTALSTQYKPAG